MDGRRAASGVLGLLAACACLRAEEPRMDERVRRVVEGALVARVEPAVEVGVKPDLPYTAEGDAGPRLDLYAAASGASASRPAWIFVHGGPLPPGGGALPSPRRWRFFRDYGAIAASACRVGIVVGHRYTGLDGIDRSEADVRAAVAWVRAHAGELGVDPERLALWLFSGAGVHLPSFLAEPPAGVRSLVAFYPAVGAETLAAMGVGAMPETLPAPAESAAPDAARTPRLFIARAALDHPALNAALDRFVAAQLANGGELEVVNHPSGHHGFELQDDDERSREIVESALRFLVRGESATERLPRVVRPAGE
jgi:dienelactone hydrolase